jgi:hypothetical protein
MEEGMIWWYLSSRKMPCYKHKIMDCIQEKNIRVRAMRSRPQNEKGEDGTSEDSPGLSKGSNTCKTHEKIQVKAEGNKQTLTKNRVWSRHGLKKD